MAGLNGNGGGCVGRAIPDAGFDVTPYGGDAWRLTAEGPALGLARTAAAFALGNGFIGLRSPGDRAAGPRVFLNGVFEKVAIPYHEAAFGYARESDMRLTVADATSPAITIDGLPLGPPFRLELDMRAGLRVDHFLVQGVYVVVEQLVSMARAAIVACRVTVPASEAHRLAVRPLIADPAARDEAIATPGGPYDPRVSPALTASPWRERHHITTGTRAERVDSLAHSGFAVAAITLVSAVSADGACIELIAGYAADRGGDPRPAALAAIEDAQAAGFAALLAEQASWFAAHWHASMTACADHPKAEQALHHAQFQLIQAVGRDGATSLAAKGQTGEGYEGHVFWDADLYALPVFALTRPEIARALLVWRIAGLDAARANARAMGQNRGALYPWRTIAGGECSSFFPAGSAQYHINADIAFALRSYLDATADESILDDGGAAMLVETARIWIEIGHHDSARDDAFVIDRVTGPDEYSALVDNNLYTNMMAAEHLRDAARIGEARQLIDATEAARMRRAADRMWLPFDKARGIYAQDDAFFAKQPWPFAETPASEYPLLLHHHPLKIYRHQVCKQADAVLAIALLSDRFDAAMRARMLDAYEAVTVHDSTLSASIFAIAAAQVGDTDRAWRYWRASVLTDLGDLFGNSGHGLHMAALAGAWSAMAMGFAGLRVRDGGLAFDPVPIPDLGRYTFTLRFRGSLLEIAVDAANACYRLIEGQPLTIRHHDVDAAVGTAAITLPLAP